MRLGKSVGEAKMENCISAKLFVDGIDRIIKDCREEIVFRQNNQTTSRQYVIDADKSSINFILTKTEIGGIQDAFEYIKDNVGFDESLYPQNESGEVNFGLMVSSTINADYSNFIKQVKGRGKRNNAKAVCCLIRYIYFNVINNNENKELWYETACKNIGYTRHQVDIKGTDVEAPKRKKMT